MIKLYILLGTSLVTLVLYWAFSHHFVRIGEDECIQADNKALITQLEKQGKDLNNALAANAKLQSQHDEDVKTITAAAARANTALSHVRVCRSTSNNSAVPATNSSSGGQSGQTSAINGSAGSGNQEVDLSVIVPDLTGCESDASELNIMKTWAKGLVHATN